MSNFVRWEEAYSVEVKRMDLQHKVIIRLMNDLYEKNQESDLESIPELVSLLVSVETGYGKFLKSGS